MKVRRISEFQARIDFPNFDSHFEKHLEALTLFMKAIGYKRQYGRHKNSLTKRSKYWVQMLSMQQMQIETISQKGV